MKCLVCEKEFDGRADAVCCSTKCRVKRNRLSVTGGVTDRSVTDNVTDRIEAACGVLRDEIWVDVERDLGLDLGKDLGLIGWTKDGIFIRSDITIDQVQNIARLVAAKNGRVASFYEARL